MKNFLTAIVLACMIQAIPVFGQGFTFSLPNTNFLLIPGGSVETKAWVSVPQGDSAVLTTNATGGITAFFQPSVVRQSCFVYLIIISVDSSLQQQLSFQATATCNSNVQQKWVHVANANDGNGYLLIDSARFWIDTAFGYLKHSYPTQKIFLNQIETLPWIATFPYPPLWIVTHHLFVSGNWRATVLWHNMIPPDNWEKIFIYNEIIDTCYGVHVDSYGQMTLIPCEIMHYNYQDTITSVPDDRVADPVKIWPNPAGEAVNMSLPEGTRLPVVIRIFDGAGRILAEEIIHTSDAQIDTREFPAGLYVFQTEGENLIFREKLIIR